MAYCLASALINISIRYGCLQNNIDHYTASGQSAPSLYSVCWCARDLYGARDRTWRRLTEIITGSLYDVHAEAIEVTVGEEYGRVQEC